MEDPVAGSGASRTLQALREEIDSIDARILELLEERVRCSGEIAAIKPRLQLPAVDEGREREILGRIGARELTSLSPEGVRRVWQAILELSRG